MIPKHTNPNFPRSKFDKKKGKKFEYWARAPYNFIPLPDEVVTVGSPLGFEKYNGESGYIELEIETLSPTFIRGVLTPEQGKRFGSKRPEDLSDDEKVENASFYYLQPNDKVEGHPKPTIPGSSIRGLLRTLVEIISFSKIRWVNSDYISFRAVALGKEDPLSQPYKDILAGLSTGYLLFENNQWKIVPALKPRDLKYSEKGAYLKVKKYVNGLNHISGFRDFDDPNYEYAYFPVRFDAENRRDKNGNPYTAITNIGGEDTIFAQEGMLVCTGNMLETGGTTSKSPRVNFSLILRKSDSTPIPIPDNVLEDYLSTLTDYQKSAPFDTKNGFLQHGAPVFYATKSNNIVAIGHTPNFRVPARRPGESRASTPKEFVPANLMDRTKIDLADSIFGWVAEDKSQQSIAGRIFVEDAILNDENTNIWYHKDYIIPQILGSPKPTTFPHYLVQDGDTGNSKHNPDIKTQLAHYGTPNTETVIRGYKWYWHKGQKPAIKIDMDAEKLEEKKKQLTKIRPLNPGVKFTCKIHFENIREEELGALLWAISLPIDDNKTYRHKIGMGKPLGMGSIELKILSLVSINRSSRYKDSLFAKNSPKWHDGGTLISSNLYIKSFENLILKKLATQKKKFSEIPRIADLLLMLEWNESPEQEWLEWLRYMSIEHPKLENEYKERPVLPTPGGVFGIWSKNKK